MAKSKATLENELRVKALAVISAALEKEFDSEILPTSSSEIAIPVVDSEKNECFIKVKVSIPRGTRSNGTYEPYDGYAERDDWKATLEERADKAAARAEKKERAEAEKERKRAARQTIKTMKKDIQEALPTAAAVAARKMGGEKGREMVETISA